MKLKRRNFSIIHKRLSPWSQYDAVLLRASMSIGINAPQKSPYNISKILDGLPCCDGTGNFAHRTQAARARSSPCTDGLSSEIFQARRPSVVALAQQRCVACLFFCATFETAGRSPAGIRRGVRLRSTGLCALTAWRKNGPLAPA
jgi:hypothetical protein